MHGELLNKIRKLNEVLQESLKGTISFNELCSLLSDLTEANVYLADQRGFIIGVSYKHREDSAADIDPETGQERFSEKYNNAMMAIEETVENLRNQEALAVFSEHELTKDKYHTIIPVKTGEERWGNLILIRYSPAFTEEDLVLGEVGASVVAIEMRRKDTIQKETILKEEEIVTLALQALSYSENQAIKKIFEELGGSEGVIVASAVAEKSDITRSVIVNSLRKLESAGVIESRSLGMKGTHIRVLNPQFLGMIENIR